MNAGITVFVNVFSHIHTEIMYLYFMFLVFFYMQQYATLQPYTHFPLETIKYILSYLKLKASILFATIQFFSPVHFVFCISFKVKPVILVCSYAPYIFQHF